jgi:hypothetical protein
MKTTAIDEVADYVWLTGNEAGTLLAELAEEDSPLHTLLASLRRKLSAERAHRVVEQLDLRRRATAKFTQAHRMFFTRLGLEQATDEWIAAYKAARMAPRREAGTFHDIIVDLCCGIGGDLMALSRRGNALGVDRDPVAAHFASTNSGVNVQVANVRDVDLRTVAAWHIDPDRRPAGRRTTSLDYCEPSIATIERFLSVNPHAAIKLAPATITPSHWGDRSELEWISRDRECRQLVAWHGELAQSPGRHRATIVAKEHGMPIRTIVGAADQIVATTATPDRFVFDVDAAVLAAHLKGALAAEHELKALSSGPTYLTGRRPLCDAALSCFEVVEVLPFDRRKLAGFLRERCIGRLEIKTRGVDLDPHSLRRELKLRGDNELTLLITNMTARPMAILARRP